MFLWPIAANALDNVRDLFASRTLSNFAPQIRNYALLAVPHAIAGHIVLVVARVLALNGLPIVVHVFGCVA